MINSSQYPIIAGRSAGKRIRCVSKYQPAITRLEQAAKRGNPWATNAIKELNTLTTGVSDKSNVFIRPGVRDSLGNVPLTVFLPGLKATVVRWPNDEYCITEMCLDGMYSAVKESQDRTRMGLYRVSHTEGRAKNEWKVKYVDDGNILAKDSRVVAVADWGYDTAEDAANKAIPNTVNAPNVSEVNLRSNGCDLHYTPGQSRLDDLVQYNALAIDSSRASAYHLAQTMYNARHLKDIVWVADRGGACVLTQAMQILVDKGVTLPSHTAYLYQAGTSPGDALNLAHRLEMSLDKDFAKTTWNLRGTLSMLSVADRRLKNEKDLYNKRRYAHDWITGLVITVGPLAVLDAGSKALGMSIPMVGAIATVISSGGVVYALGQSVAEDVRHKLRR